ncbi:MAG: hypothetical protein ACREIF_02180 [Chthoniobacterales bacterium]
MSSHEKTDQRDFSDLQLGGAGLEGAASADRFSDVIGRYLRGKMTLPEARLEVKQFLDSIGYSASEEEAGTIKDLSSDARINLELDTRAQSAASYRQWVSRQRQTILDGWPCDELIRGGWRKTHRQWSGLDDGNIIAGEPADGRWREAGGQLYDGRMIALVNDPIWTDISRFGVPYPPFDFNSGMKRRGVDRKTAIKLGVFTADNPPQQLPQTRNFNDDHLKFTTAIRDAALRGVLEDEG